MHPLTAKFQDMGVSVDSGPPGIPTIQGGGPGQTESKKREELFADLMMILSFILFAIILLIIIICITIICKGSKAEAPPEKGLETAADQHPMKPAEVPPPVTSSPEAPPEEEEEAPSEEREADEEEEANEEDEEES